MLRRRKLLFVIVWAMIFIMGIYILVCGMMSFSEAVDKKADKLQQKIVTSSLEISTKIFFPVVECAIDGLSEKSTPEKIADFFAMYGNLHPFSYNILKNTDEAVEVLSENIINQDNAKIIIAENIKKQALSDKNAKEALQSRTILENKDALLENSTEELQNNETVEAVGNAEGIEKKEVSGVSYDANTLDYDFLMNNFYTVDSTTSITKEQLNATELLGMDMTMKTSADKPQILIYHTHSQEAFIDSKEGDSSTTVVGVGEYLCELLKNKYGFNVIHDTTEYDIIDGKIDRNKAYSLAGANVTKILKENPSIEVVIDLHRDGVEGEKPVTEINGKKTAKIMFFNGLSYTNKNGKIGYLENPYIKDNLSFSLKLQIEAAKYYPGFTRKIYLKGYRYNLHLCKKSLLIESGSQNNTVEEQKNAMEPLADILARVLNGTE